MNAFAGSSGLRAHDQGLRGPDIESVRWTDVRTFLARVSADDSPTKARIRRRRADRRVGTRHAQGALAAPRRMSMSAMITQSCTPARRKDLRREVRDVADMDILLG